MGNVRERFYVGQECDVNEKGVWGEGKGVET
jgi:hypothetical protein